MALAEVGTDAGNVLVFPETGACRALTSANQVAFEKPSGVGTHKRSGLIAKDSFFQEGQEVRERFCFTNCGR